MRRRPRASTSTSTTSAATTSKPPLGALRRGGRVALCGAVSEYEAGAARGPANLFRAVTHELTLRGFRGSRHVDRLPAVQRELAGWMRDGRLRCTETVVDGLERAPEALDADARRRDDREDARQDRVTTVSRSRIALTISRLTGFSDGVRGKSSNASTRSGQVYFATPFGGEELLQLVERRRELSRLGDHAAHARSPMRSSGIGTTATSWTAGWRRITGSISAGTIVTPPRRMMSLLRPTNSRWPSASSAPRSPVR